MEREERRRRRRKELQKEEERRGYGENGVAEEEGKSLGGEKDRGNHAALCRTSALLF